MLFTKKLSSVFVALFISTFCFSQSYFANGSAKATGGSCYRLTSANDWQLGSVWYADKLDLTKNFDLEFELNFGNNDDGADGIVFVLQTSGNKALGAPGGGIGFEGFSPSLGVEFDDWNNIDRGDLTYDHIAILKNGSVDHNSNDAITKPIPALPNLGNIEDGKNHLVRITWNASTNLFEVWFDCEKRQRINLDIVKAIFNGESEVYWGFTSATGGSNNTHIACLRDNILVNDSFFMCAGESTTLNVRESSDNKYEWTPSTYLSDNTIQNPICNSPEPITYFVNYLDKCGNQLTDTIHVGVIEKPNLEDFDDLSLCIDEETTLSVSNPYGTVIWNNNQTGDSFDLLNYEGLLFVKSSNLCGSDSLEVNIAIVDCICDMWFPNVITPNQDGLNDTFGPIDICNELTSYDLAIFNRWGEQVFQTDDVNDLWDGLNAQNNVVPGVYFWVAAWSNIEKGQTKENTFSGTLSVIE